MNEMRAVIDMMARLIYLFEKAVLWRLFPRYKARQFHKDLYDMDYGRDMFVKSLIVWHREYHPPVLPDALPQAACPGPNTKGTSTGPVTRLKPPCRNIALCRSVLCR